MGIHEDKDKTKFNQQSESIAEYSLMIDDLEETHIKDSSELKNALWAHLEGLAKEGYPKAEIYDIQFALNDTGYLDLLEVVTRRKHKLRLIERQMEKDKNLTKAFEKQEEKVNKAQAEVDKYKTNYRDSYPIKAFVMPENVNLMFQYSLWHKALFN